MRERIKRKEITFLIFPKFKIEIGSNFSYKITNKIKLSKKLKKILKWGNNVPDNNKR